MAWFSWGAAARIPDSTALPVELPASTVSNRTAPRGTGAAGHGAGGMASGSTRQPRGPAAWHLGGSHEMVRAKR